MGLDLNIKHCRGGSKAGPAQACVGLALSLFSYLDCTMYQFVGVFSCLVEFYCTYFYVFEGFMCSKIFCDRKCVVLVSFHFSCSEHKTVE